MVAFCWLALVSLYFWQRRRWQVAAARDSGPTGTSRAMAKLIDVCIDDERMLGHESRVVHGFRGAVLERLAAERTAFVEQLRDLDGVGAGSHHGSWIGRGREWGRSLRVGVGGPNDGDAVAACRRSNERAEARFDAALDLSWPELTRATLFRQRMRLDIARDALIGIEY
jgi:hypothetical protein